MYFKDDIKSLYVHVPFCNSKCSYCDFFSLENIDFKKKKAVTDATVEQIKYFSRKYGFGNLETVYIGGGTPTSLPPSLLEKLIFSIADITGENIKEFSIEINPETVDEELIIFLKDTPLTRLSIGIQSFNNTCLKILGRNCTPGKSRYAIELLMETGKDINIDLISSIPGQKQEDSIYDVKEALGFSPSHISLYSLTIEENTPIADKLSSKDIDDEVWIRASEYLENSGFDHYEISNFSLPGKQCLHNLNYWNMSPYIGCGPAAVSTVIRNNKPFRFYNTVDIPLFLDGEKKMWNLEKEEVSADNYFIETMMMGFRTSGGINLENILKTFGADIYGIIPETIIKWTDKGMLQKTDTGLSLTGKGRLFHSSFILDIMDELERRKLPLS